MYYVYLIQSEKGVYIGYTNDLKRRLAEHNAGKSQYTRGYEWRLIYYEAYLAESDARNRERKLKQDGRAKYHLMTRLVASFPNSK